MKKFLLVLLGLFLLIPIAILVLWFNLGLIINEANAQRVVEKFKVDLTWKNLEINIANAGALSKDVHFSSQNLCLKWLPLVDTCLSQAELRFHVDFMTSSPYFELDRLYVDIKSDHLIVNLPEKKEAAPAKEFVFPKLQVGSLDQFVGQFFKQAPLAAIDKISVDLQDAQINFSPGQILTATAEIASTEQKIDLKALIQLTNQEQKVVSADLQTSLNLVSPLDLEAQASADLPGLGSRHTVHLKWKDFLSFETSTELAHKKMKVKADINGNLQKDQWLFAVKAKLQEPSLPFESIEASVCDLTLTFKEGVPQNLNWPCLIALNRMKKRPLKALPESLAVSLLLQSSIAIEKAQLELNPVLSVKMQERALAELNLETALQVDLDLEKPELKRLYLKRLTAGLKIPLFQNWVLLLDKSAWAMPAPLNVLKGQISFEASAQPAEILDRVFQIQTVLKTEMTSQRQILKTQSNINLDVDIQKPFVALNGEVLLQQVHLELPYIGLEAVPQFKPDSRFVKGAKTVAVETKKPVFEITDLKIRTEQNPILLHTRLLPNPIPVNLKYQIQKPMQMSGAVSIGKMDFEVFKKKAVLQRFNLTKFADSSVQDLDGLITHSTSEVNIQILVVGTTEKPRIEFLSDPPLSRQQIISILLFNKSLQQLADDEKSTAGQLDQALLSEAFGLASLFLLSSTPIESVYFDPATQSYIARVKLDDQTSVSLGSNFETAQQVTLRRRLGGPWSISTALQQSKNSEDIITTLIEWFQRF